MKKFIYTIVAIFIALAAQAQLVQPIKWKGEVVGDSVRLTANIEKGCPAGICSETVSIYSLPLVRYISWRKFDISLCDSI